MDQNTPRIAQQFPTLTREQARRVVNRYAESKDGAFMLLHRMHSAGVLPNKEGRYNTTEFHNWLTSNTIPENQS